MDLVFLHGPAAAGKLTVARALAARVGYPVFHNHLVLDVLTTVFPFGSAPLVLLRERMWLDVFSEAAKARTSIIFTFAPEPTVAQGFADRARSSVEPAGGAIHFVELQVSAAEQERRIGEPSRRAVGKLSDVATLRRLRRTETPVDRPPADLTIDTDASSPSQAAALIIERFRLEHQPPVQRYP